MRVGVDYRILAVGPSAATRGMPRYTQQQLREVLAAGSDDEYLLFCDPRTDQTLILPEIRSAPNVSVRIVPPEITVEFHRDEHMLAKAEIFESWLAAQKVDVYHCTAPFYLDQLIVAQHDACPWIATVYDLIPLIYPSQYLASPKLRQLYMVAAAMVSRATRLLAISAAARRDASHYLGVPEDRIDIASPIAEPFFRPLSEAEVESRLAPLRARLRLDRAFILSVADLHFTKNLETLLRGYALLPSGMRAALPLVVACHLSREHASYLATLAAKLGVGGQVFTTGLVSDQELAALYNGAEFVVHPSRFEGFGLPVLEAMQCGTPVIATTSSSIPEVAGDAAVLVDPDDAPAFAAAMQALWEDPAEGERMRHRGLARAAAYSGAALAASTVVGYARTAATVPAPQERPQVAMWSPLPPLATGVADYAGELVPPLSARCDVELFVDDGYLPSLDLLLAHPVRHFSAFARLADRYDAVVYQLGASTFHLYMAETMLRHPGIVVLHDLVWSHLVHHEWAERDDIAGFKHRLAELEGDDAVAAYDAIDRSDHRQWAGRLRAFLDDHLMLGEIVTASSAQIVHFPAGVAELARRYPHTCASYVPMGVPDAPAGRQARRSLGLSPSSFVVGVFGLVDDVKRVETTIRAMAQVVEACPDSVLLVVGPVLDPEYGARLGRLVAALGLRPAVRFAGRVSAADFDDYLAACDVVVNLRSPSRKQMSATVLRAAAAGKPVILSAVPEWGFLPSSFCRRVADGEGDEAELAAHLLELATDPVLRSDLSAAARLFHRSEATLGKMVAGYVDVLESVLDRRLRGRDTAAGRDPAPGRHLNKVCEVEDGSEDRHGWEVAMAVRTLRECGVLRPDAVVLGVGAGTEDTAFDLTRQVARVVVIDRYLDPDRWNDGAPPALLDDPASVAPYPFDGSRLVVRHMDGRVLAFDGNTFDGICSSGFIGHAGDLEDVAAAAYEMGRVLKPGGVLSISADLLLSGPPGGKGTPGTFLLSPADVRRCIVEASGLEPVDDLRFTVSPATLAGTRDLAHAIRDRHAAWPGDPGLGMPQLISVANGYVYASVHLALRKGERYPAVPNMWARPSAAMRRAVDAANRAIVVSAPAIEARSGRSDGHRPPVTVPREWPRLAALARELAGSARMIHTTASDRTARIVTLHPHVDAIVATLRAEEKLSVDCVTAIDAALGGWPEPPIDLGSAHPEPADETPAKLDGPALRPRPDVIEPGEVVLDIGAGMGDFTLAAAAAGCRAIALDPSPANVARLRAAAARDGFADTVVVTMVASEAPVDALLAELGIGGVDVVRMSAGHADVVALRGMRGVLTREPAPRVLFAGDGTGVTEELASLGYTVVASPSPTGDGSAVDYLAQKVEPAP